MKGFKSVVVARIFGLICFSLLFGLTLRAQDAGTISLTPADVASLNSLSATQLAALISTPEATPTISADSVPPGATYYSLQTTMPPMPFNLSGSPVWSMGGNSYLENDINYDYNSPSSGGIHAMDMDGPSLPGGLGTNDSGDDVTNSYTPYVVPTNGLWLQIANTDLINAYLNLNNATDSVYEILTKTDLTASTWQSPWMTQILLRMPVGNLTREPTSR
jgi:hypothetical protein